VSLHTSDKASKNFKKWVFGEGLANRFAKHIFTNKQIRERSLDLLAKEYVAANDLIPILKEAVQGLDLSSLLEIDDSRLRTQRLKLIASFVGHSAAQGDTQPFEFYFAQVRDLKARNDYYRRTAIAYFITDFREGMTAFLSGALTAETLLLTLPILRELALITSDQSSQSLSERAPLSLIYHARANRIHDFDTALATLSKAVRERLESEIMMERVNAMLGQLLPKDHMLQKERLRVAREVIYHPLIASHLAGSSKKDQLPREVLEALQEEPPTPD
jgi:hypothetical protein